MQTRYAPRKLDIEVLVRTLVAEHRVMKDGLRRARESARVGEFDAASTALKEVDPVFRQHIADEEATVLGLLIRSVGAKGAEAEILVFRQHRPIYELMQRVAELAKLSPAELMKSQADLESLFEKHTLAEEEAVFPKALALNSGQPRGG